LIPVDRIERAILLIRGQKVLLDGLTDAEASFVSNELLSRTLAELAKEADLTGLWKEGEWEEVLAELAKEADLSGLWEGEEVDLAEGVKDETLRLGENWGKTGEKLGHRKGK
jgi:hypothetical protein